MSEKVPKSVKWVIRKLSEKEILRIVGEINQWDRDAWIRKTTRYNFITKQIPKDLKGKNVLDIGTLEGYFSFLAEKRGANRVLAIDNVEQEGFHLVKKMLKSKVFFPRCSLPPKIPAAGAGENLSESKRSAYHRVPSKQG